MTRINVGILPSMLCDQHLMAEHREIKRIPNCISKGKFSLKGIPTEFKLGSGHVKFFYNKLEYLRRRYKSLYIECMKRGLNVTYYGEAWNDLPSELMNDYSPTKNDQFIIKCRINERLDDMMKKLIKKGRIEQAEKLSRYKLFLHLDCEKMIKK